MLRAPAGFGGKLRPSRSLVGQPLTFISNVTDLYLP